MPDTRKTTLQEHKNEVVPHKISNHDVMVQTSTMVDGEWVNIADTNDANNLKIDLHRVAKAVDEQVQDIDKAVQNANKAVDSADKAAEQANINKKSIDAVNSAVSDAKQSAKAALSDAMASTSSNIAKTATQIKDEITSAVSAVDIKVNVNSAAIIKNSNAIELQSRSTSDAIADLKVADGNITAIASGAKDLATVAQQTASAASVEAMNASSDVAKAKLTADKLTIQVTNAANTANKAATEVTQVKDQINLKADASSVDQLKKTVDANHAQLGVMSDEIKSKVDSSSVEKLIDSKGFVNQKYVSSIVDQKASSLTSTMTELKNQVDSAGKIVATNSDKVSNLAQTVDGFQTIIKNKADQSSIQQLSNQILSKVSTKDYTAEIAELTKSINLRVKQGDVISQINQEAGGPTLIQVANGKGKLLLDADSVVFKDKAFIPSAAITDISADKIKTGTLSSVAIDNGNGAFTVNAKGDVRANSIFLKNGTMYNGNLIGASIYAIDNPKSSDLADVDDSKQSWYKINGDMAEWHNHNSGSYSSLGVGLTINKFVAGQDQPVTVIPAGLTIADTNEIYIGTGSTMYNHVNPIENKQNMAWMSATNLKINDTGVQVNLNGGTPNERKSAFAVQKDNLVGFYVGNGDQGRDIEIAGAGPIYLRGGRYIDGSLDNDVTNTLSNLQVRRLHVYNWLGVDGSKNSIVKTSQGTVAINAYETAEYYFGDIGSGSTGSECKTIIGIEKLFNETVNTKIEYQVFVTPYDKARIWVSKREQDRFVVESDTPNARFGYEIKAKRRGYENNRLKNVDNELNNMATV